MKLISVALHGYKRYEYLSSMNVDGKLVAIVGPNESGKSSFLQALMHLNHNGPLNVSGAARETTRNIEIPVGQKVIEATYLLDDKDKEALSEVHGGREIRWCKISKQAEKNNLRYGLTPRPRRSLQPRIKAGRMLNKDSSRKGFRSVDEEYEEVDLRAEVENLASALDTEAETLSDETLEQIRSVVTTLEDATDSESPKYLNNLIQELQRLAEYETGNPVQQAINILSRRRPEFLFFSDEKRMLQSEYTLNEVWEEPPAALDNLVRLADLDLETLHNATVANDSAEVESLLEQANARLQKEFYESWTQSKVAVRLRTDQLILKILIREETSGNYPVRFTSIAERSDGLRQFVALVAFAASKPSTHSPILLIDEIETHLHYDAQADLIQMLTKQEIASKVIYTTHSIGCLPEDLGVGVRFIETNDPESFTSRIENAFWTSNKSGFSPLLFGMGASTLAFVPLRSAVIAEGPSDMILWPTLLREATDYAHLDFQVVPGLSKQDRRGIIVLDRGAPRTAYLLDSDEGGNELRRKLKSAGIPEDKIFHIPDDQMQGLVVEDLIDSEIYVRSVNEEIQRSHGSTHSFPDGRLPEVNRPVEIERWCNENSISAPKKVAVAYRVLEAGVGGTVLATHYRAPLKELFEDINTALQDRT
jgi:predicted ATP-dependent endonuclease of OLD family